MIAFVFLNSFKDPGIRNFIDENALIIYPAFIVLFVIFSLILGRLDTKYGIRKEEMRYNSTENPITMDIWKILKKIEKGTK